MGLFKFMKEAGAKLFGAGEAKAATSDALKKELQGHGFDAGKLNIDIKGDKVKLSGQTMTQEAEKINLGSRKHGRGCRGRYERTSGSEACAGG
jgi:hypothetical protein